MTKSVYKQIRDQNGELFARTLRDNSANVLEIPNIVNIVKYAGHTQECAKQILPYLQSLIPITVPETSICKNPLTLLDQAGYNAYIADTLEKQNAIKKYFAKNEELCTFHDPNRYKNYFIVNAVRKDVDKIKREDFQNPKRDDKYGTSVLSIQIAKSGGFISIKNRYNHSVPNPDNTLYSNPDNIITGLSSALRHRFNVNFSTPKANIPSGYLLTNNLIIKYEYEIDGIFFGEKHYVKNGQLHTIEPDYEIMLGNGLLLNIKTKTVTALTDYVSDTYRQMGVLLNQAFQGRKIRISPNPDDTKSKEFFIDNKKIWAIKNNQITYINVPTVTHIALYPNTTNLHGDINFSNTQKLFLHGVNMEQCSSVKMPKNAKKIEIYNTNLPCQDLDFSNVQDLTLSNVYIKQCTNIKATNVKKVDIYNTTMPTKNLDFSNVQKLYLSRTNMEQCAIPQMPTNATEIHMSHTILPAGKFDFSDTLRVAFVNSDLSNVTELQLPKHNTIENCKPPLTGVDKIFQTARNLRVQR